MQNRLLPGEETDQKTKEDVLEVNGGMPLLTGLCLAMRSDPLGVERELREVVTYVYGTAATLAFPDSLITGYRHSEIHMSLISVLDGKALNWCKQEYLRARMSETMLFGKIKNPELIVLNFRGQLQCRMG